ncbi:EF hand family protein [Histomonas meleagridis]|uniref:EF hand family protein n=1 Tax=Histomonas meleagridis TaxID=135588 RepID=UPI003559C9C9|nr:EF hand family protein [Histomonas meleagridis]KAH0797035.1 EF hand family protein [Histomonas meleagridis]
MKDGRVQHQKTFTEKELAEVKEIFDGMDADHNGVLDRNEMSEFLAKLDMEGELADLMFAIYDHDHNKVLDFNEFCHFAKDMMKTSDDPLYFVGVLFTALDTDKSGALSGDELARFLKLLGINAKPEDFGNRQITLAEFLESLQ